MRKLAAAIKMDIRLHKRYGFYYAAAFITVVWFALLRTFLSAYLTDAIPFIIFADLGIVGFYFIAGQIIFEKTERTIYALVVTPLTVAEYLISKLFTLTFLAWIISMIVVISSYGLEFNVLSFSIGVILMSLIVLLIGVIGVMPYNSISSFLLPSQLYFLVINLPLLYYWGWWQNPLLYLIPTQGALLLMKNAFTPIETWQLFYAVVYQLIWLIILGRVALGRFEGYIVAQKGGR